MSIKFLTWRERFAKNKLNPKQKPRPIGIEMKDLCCGECKIVVGLELVETPDKQQQKEGTNELGSSCATTIWLVTPYKGTFSTVIADSWFGSVLCAKELKKLDVFSIMDIKVACRGFPKSTLKTKLNRGAMSLATKTEDDVNLIAVSWKDKSDKQFIATCGELGYSETGRITRNGTEIPRPKIATEYFENVAAIDVKNHTRLGGKNGGWKDVFRTTTPWRKYFSGFIGMI